MTVTLLDGLWTAVGFEHWEASGCFKYKNRFWCSCSTQRKMIVHFSGGFGILCDGTYTLSVELALPETLWPPIAMESPGRREGCVFFGFLPLCCPFPVLCEDWDVRVTLFEQDLMSWECRQHLSHNAFTVFLKRAEQSEIATPNPQGQLMATGPQQQQMSPEADFLNVEAEQKSGPGLHGAAATQSQSLANEDSREEALAPTALAPAEIECVVCTFTQPAGLAVCIACGTACIPLAGDEEPEKSAKYIPEQVQASFAAACATDGQDDIVARALAELLAPPHSVAERSELAAEEQVQIYSTIDDVASPLQDWLASTIPFHTMEVSGLLAMIEAETESAAAEHFGMSPVSEGHSTAEELAMSENRKYDDFVAEVVAELAHAVPKDHWSSPEVAMLPPTPAAVMQLYL